MGRLVKLIGSGIGLASEAIANYKAPQTLPESRVGESSRTAAARSPRDAPPQYVEVADDRADELIENGRAVPVDSKEKSHLKYEDEDEDDDDTLSEEGDEEQWDLDDAVEEQISPNSEEGPAQDANLLTDAFMRSHPPPPYREGAATGKLPCPVIIPQRRPRDNKRGFVRAYAPALAECGIDQDTFLDFLKTFHAASKSSPWLQVVNVAAAGAGMAPSAIAMGVSIGVQVCAGIAMEVQARTRTNSFLDRMNNEFFKPHGLYCLIMTYKPEASTTHASVDITKSISSSMTPGSSGMRQTLNNLRLSSGTTYGELELPEAAPLIFPALDTLAASTSAEGIQKKSKLKSSQKFIADYFDRRAQAEYANQNPTSALAVPSEKRFASRYADPTHPANSGSLISLLTGGVVNPAARREMRRSARRDRREDRRERRAVRRGREITSDMARRRPREGIVRRILKKDVLYLMIVNLPSEAELATGRALVANETAYRY